jgi:hypothetical protein
VRDFSGTRAVGLALVLFWVAFVASHAAPQYSSVAPAPPSIDQLDHPRLADGPSDIPRELQARQQRQLREEHQKQVLTDAARLVQLATALKLQVQKGDKVSLDAIKDVDEIGKLAKRLSDRIKTQ